MTSELLSPTSVPPHTQILDLNETTKHNICCLQPGITARVQKFLLLPAPRLAFSAPVSSFAVLMRKRPKLELVQLGRHSHVHDEILFFGVFFIANDLKRPDDLGSTQLFYIHACVR